MAQRRADFIGIAIGKYSFKISADIGVAAQSRQRRGLRWGG
jgi:hypothetical protein